MEIIRNDDGTLVVPVPVARHHEDDESAAESEAAVTTRVLHPGEGGFDEALAAWDLQQDPDRPAALSTEAGREEAMGLVHVVATSAASAAEAVGALEHPEATGGALRHVLVGGVHAAEDFAAEVALAEGGDTLPPHETTKIIGEVLAKLDE